MSWLPQRNPCRPRRSNDLQRFAMKVTSKDGQYVADLAHLDLAPEERTRMERDLNSILDYIDRLNELDTSNVPPMAQVAQLAPMGDGGENDGHWREDQE